METEKLKLKLNDLMQKFSNPQHESTSNLASIHSGFNGFFAVCGRELYSLNLNDIEVATITFLLTFFCIYLLQERRSLNKKMDKKDMYTRVYQTIMKYDPYKPMECHPQIHMGLTVWYMTSRQEIQDIKEGNSQRRKEKMRKLLLSDYLQEDKELREVDLAFMNTQP